MNNYKHIQFKKHWKIEDKTMNYLGQCESIVNVLSNTPIRPSRRDELHKLSLIKGAQATTAIEGNTLSLEEIMRVGEGEKLPPSKEYQEIEVRNVIDSFNNLLTKVSYGELESPITPELLLEFHHMIGSNLGEHFDAIPGRFREDRRVVGKYLCPDHRKVKELVYTMCKWLKEEFSYGMKNDFTTSIVRAIVTHIYIEWIHPFGDGNGRTGRLVEFYILIRGGLPSIASHILSNFYNETRTEYYRQIDNAREKNDLTDFINYAVLGFRDGLQETLDIIQKEQFRIHWRYHIYQLFADVTYLKKNAFKRKRNLILEFPLEKTLHINEIPDISTKVARDYATLKPITLKRDLEELIKMGLIQKRSNQRYKAFSDVLKYMMPLSKKSLK